MWVRNNYVPQERTLLEEKGIETRKGKGGKQRESNIQRPGIEKCTALSKHNYADCIIGNREEAGNGLCSLKKRDNSTGNSGNSKRVKGVRLAVS